MCLKVQRWCKYLTKRMSNNGFKGRFCGPGSLNRIIDQRDMCTWVANRNGFVTNVMLSSMSSSSELNVLPFWYLLILKNNSPNRRSIFFKLVLTVHMHIHGIHDEPYLTLNTLLFWLFVCCVNYASIVCTYKGVFFGSNIRLALAYNEIQSRGLCGLGKVLFENDSLRYVYIWGNETDYGVADVSALYQFHIVILLLRVYSISSSIWFLIKRYFTRLSKSFIIEPVVI